jgi:cytochrome P450
MWPNGTVSPPKSSGQCPHQHTIEAGEPRLTRDHEVWLNLGYQATRQSFTARMVERLFIAPLPITVICELFGIPEQDRLRLRGWARKLMSSDLPMEGSLAGASGHRRLPVRADRAQANRTR